MTKTITKRDVQLTRLLKRSHKLQFEGMDWQVAVNELLPELENWTDEEARFLSSSPDPGCECGYCKKAEWPDD